MPATEAANDRLRPLSCNSVLAVVTTALQCVKKELPPLGSSPAGVVCVRRFVFLFRSCRNPFAFCPPNSVRFSASKHQDPIVWGMRDGFDRCKSSSTLGCEATFVFSSPGFFFDSLLALSRTSILLTPFTCCARLKCRRRCSTGSAGGRSGPVRGQSGPSGRGPWPRTPQHGRFFLQVCRNYLSIFFKWAPVAKWPFPY